MKSLSDFQYSLYKKFKLEAQDLMSHPSKALREYQNDFLKIEKRRFQVGNYRELLNIVKKSQLVFIGDFHTFDQPSRNMQRILGQQDHSVFIALESIHSKYQFYIDVFLSGQMTELEFLESIQYHDSWRFPWKHYRPIFELAKKNKWKIIGLNTEGNLKNRDLHAADIIADLTFNHPHYKIFIFYGEYHIIPKHIPLLVEKKIKKAPRYCIIYQNLDTPYWKMTKNKMKSNVIKFNQKEFSIQSSPPWIKYQSFIHWVENYLDAPENEIRQAILNHDLIFSKKQAEEYIYETIQHLFSILEIEKKVPFDIDFSLKSHEFLRHKKITRDEELLILRGIPFKFIHKNDFFCPTFSRNQLNFISGLILENFLSHDSVPMADINHTRLLKSYLFAHVCQKLLNPYRKEKLYIDIQAEIKKHPKRPESRCYRTIIKAIETENLKFLEKMYTTDQVHCCYLLGKIFGEYLYFKLESEKQTDLNLSRLSFSELKTKIIPKTWKQDGKVFF